jgi:acyl carrier protein
MSINYTEKLIELISEILDIDESELTPESGPHEIEEWDSVNTLRILTAIESEWNIRLTLEEYNKAQNIKELSELLSRSAAHHESRA